MANTNVTENVNENVVQDVVDHTVMKEDGDYRRKKNFRGTSFKEEKISIDFLKQDDAKTCSRVKIVNQAIMCFKVKHIKENTAVLVLEGDERSQAQATLIRGRHVEIFSRA